MSLKESIGNPLESENKKNEQISNSKNLSLFGLYEKSYRNLFLKDRLIEWGILTSYPFDYIGYAPDRYIVQATLVE